MNPIANHFKQLVCLFPEGSLQLNSGATESQLDELTAMLKTSLPSALRELLSQANGQKEEGASLWGYFRFLPASVIANDYRLHLKYQRELENSEALKLHDNRVSRTHDWNVAWLPFARVFTNSLFIDQSPAAGLHGQIVLWNGDDCFAKVIAADLEQFFVTTLALAKEQKFVEGLGYGFDYDSI